MWGGDAECEHVFDEEHINVDNRTTANLNRNRTGRANGVWDTPRTHVVKRASCTRCSAWRGELGSEPTPALFVAHLVEVFRSVRRVMRDDAVLFVNLGDSYAGSGKAPQGSTGIVSSANRRLGAAINQNGRAAVYEGTRPKSLLLIPDRFAVAMSDDGWIVRDCIVWAKTSCMPESVRDRCTRSWEHIWMFTKQPNYYWDQEAVRQEGKGTGSPKFGVGTKGGPSFSQAPRWQMSEKESGANLRNAWTLGPDTGFLALFLEYGRSRWDGWSREQQLWFTEEFDALLEAQDALTNRWTLGPDPLPTVRDGETGETFDHFASFPRELVRRCVLASTSERGACAACGAPWRRTVKRSKGEEVDTPKAKAILEAGQRPAGCNGTWGSTLGIGGRGNGGAWAERGTKSETTGWAPSCAHDPSVGTRPCVVLDPFSGSGRTVEVASLLGREGWGLELSPDYVRLSMLRLRQDVLELL